jgi:hypothetical protein
MLSENYLNLNIIYIIGARIKRSKRLKLFREIRFLYSGTTQKNKECSDTQLLIKILQR